MDLVLISNEEVIRYQAQRDKESARIAAELLLWKSCKRKGAEGFGSGSVAVDVRAGASTRGHQDPKRTIPWPTSHNLPEEDTFSLSKQIYIFLDINVPVLVPINRRKERARTSGPTPGMGGRDKNFDSRQSQKLNGTGRARMNINVTQLSLQ